jgi:hypothetical protein
MTRTDLYPTQLMQIAIFIGIKTEHAANNRFAAVILAHSSTGCEPPAALPFNTALDHHAVIGRSCQLLL